MKFLRGPTILAFAAVLATFALALSLFSSTGTASAATLDAYPGFVTVGGTDDPFQAQLVTSNTSQGTTYVWIVVDLSATPPTMMITSAVLPGDASHPPAGVVGSADVLSTTLGTSRGSLGFTADATSRDTQVAVIGTYGLQLHKDLVLGGSNIHEATAVMDPNSAIGGQAGSSQAVLTNTTFTLMFVLISLALAASARFLGKKGESFGIPMMRADFMVLKLGRVTTRAVMYVVRLFGGMPRATTRSTAPSI